MDPSQIRTQSTAWFLVKSFAFYTGVFGLSLSALDRLFGLDYTLAHEALRALFFGVFWTLTFGLSQAVGGRRAGIPGVLLPAQAGRISIDATEQQAVDACRAALSNIGACDVRVEEAHPPRIKARVPGSWSFFSGGTRGEKIVATLGEAPDGAVTVEVGSRSRARWPLTFADVGHRNLENVEAILREVTELVGKDPAADSTGSADRTASIGED
jgi:hypothetical protein